uniref:Putative secreted protein n=1 Tax=Panstrongylus lignarius TaxID=156445 RepID=A0A224Y4W0_9HEMI
MRHGAMLVSKIFFLISMFNGALKTCLRDQYFFQLMETLLFTSCVVLFLKEINCPKYTVSLTQSISAPFI